jgi:ABC-2 type transport system ATP-binding protein
MVIRAKGVVKRLGRRAVLDGVDLEIGAAEVVGICGENGAGKSTLLKILAGVLRADAGEVERSPRTAYAPQAPLLYDLLTPREHFRYFGAARRLSRARSDSRAADLLALYRFEAWADRPVAELSGGTRQKLNLALALLDDPAVLLLDEPYGGFEWETYLRFWDHVSRMKAAGKSVLVVSHLFYDRKHLDRVLTVEGGRLREA